MTRKNYNYYYYYYYYDEHTIFNFYFVFFQVMCVFSLNLLNLIADAGPEIMVTIPVEIAAHILSEFAVTRQII